MVDMIHIEGGSISDHLLLLFVVVVVVVIGAYVLHKVEKGQK